MKDKTQFEPATKADPKELAQTTKGDIAKLDSTITALTETVNRLAIDGAKTYLRIEQSEDTLMNAIRNFKSEILSAVDKFAGENKDYKRKDMERGHMLMEQHDKLENHESRLVVLETPK